MRQRHSPAKRLGEPRLACRDSVVSHSRPPPSPLWMRLRHRLRNWGNPSNLTRLHLAGMVRRHGFEIGEFSYGRPKVRFPETGCKLTIGRFCSIADRVEILLGGNHRTDWITTYPFAALPELWPRGDKDADVHASRGDVAIGHDVWIGSDVMILSGVRIGTGAVVAARSVVTRDVAPYAIVAGNPAKLIRLRFDESRIAALLASAWWDLPQGEFAALIPLLQSARVEDLVAAVKARRDPPG